MLKEIEEHVIQICQRLKEENYRHKSYVDTKMTPREFSVGEKVLLEVKPQKSTIKFSKNFKLDPKYVRPFEVLEIMNLVAYKITLPPVVSKIACHISCIIA